MTPSGKRILRPIALLLALIFAFEEAAKAAPISAPPTLDAQAALCADPSSLIVPFESAVLKEIHRGTNGRFVIHIQDAHSNLSGQRNLAAALDSILSSHGVRLVLSEGGADDCSLTPFKKAASKEVWKKVAKTLLVQGQISGEEYLNLTTDRPMKIVGVEDIALYLKSVEHYASLADGREQLLSHLREVRASITRMKARLYPSDIMEYEAAKRAGGSQEADFKALVALASARGESLQDFPEIRRLAATVAREAEIDFELANLEQAALAERLSRAGRPESLRESLEDAAHAGTEKVSQHLRVRALIRSAEEAKVPKADYENLSRYAAYLSDFSEVDLDGVLDELAKAEDRVYYAALPSEDARLLRALDRYATLLETAYSIRMSTKDFAQFRASEADFATIRWQAFLNRRLADAGDFGGMIPQTDLLDRGRRSLEEFYASVTERDFAFVRNLEKTMADEGEKAAVLITGGYHTPHLKKLLREKGYSFAVLTPVVLAETSQQKYESRLLAPLRGRGARTVETVSGQGTAGGSLADLGGEFSRPGKNDGVRAMLLRALASSDESPLNFSQDDLETIRAIRATMQNTFRSVLEAAVVDSLRARNAGLSLEEARPRAKGVVEAIFRELDAPRPAPKAAPARALDSAPRTAEAPYTTAAARMSSEVRAAERAAEFWAENERQKAGAFDLVRGQDKAWVGYSDMMKLGLRDRHYGKLAADYFIIDAISIAQRSLASSGVFAYRLGSGDDVVSMAFPESFDGDRVETALADVQVALETEYRSMAFAVLPPGLPTAALDALSEDESVRTVDFRPYYSNGTADGRPHPQILFKLAEGETHRQGLDRLLAAATLAPGTGDVLEVRAPLLPAAAVRLQAPELRTAQPEKSIEASLKAGELRQSALREMGALVGTEETVAAPQRAKENPLYGDTVNAGVESALAEIRARMNADTDPALPVEREYATYERVALFRILGEARKDRSGTPKLKTVRGPPDNFFFVSSDGKGGWQILLVRESVVALEHDGTLENAFLKNRRESGREGDYERKFGFKQVNDVFGHFAGNQLLKLGSLNLQNSFSEASASSGGLMGLEDVFRATFEAMSRVNEVVAEKGFKIEYDASTALTSAEFPADVESPAILLVLEKLAAARRSVTVESRPEFPGVAIRVYGTENKSTWSQIEEELAEVAAYRAHRAGLELERAHAQIREPRASVAAKNSVPAGARLSIQEVFGEDAPDVLEFVAGTRDLDAVLELLMGEPRRAGDRITTGYAVTLRTQAGPVQRLFFVKKLKSDSSLMRRFQTDEHELAQEAEIATRASRIGHSPSTRFFRFRSGTPGLVTTAAGGESIYRMFVRSEPSDPVRLVLEAAAEALADLHFRAGITHGDLVHPGLEDDLRADHIFWRRDADRIAVEFIDFGLANDKATDGQKAEELRKVVHAVSEYIPRRPDRAALVRAFSEAYEARREGIRNETAGARMALPWSPKSGTGILRFDLERRLPADLPVVRVTDKGLERPAFAGTSAETLLENPALATLLRAEGYEYLTGPQLRSRSFLEGLAAQTAREDLRLYLNQRLVYGVPRAVYARRHSPAVNAAARRVTAQLFRSVVRVHPQSAQMLVPVVADLLSRVPENQLESFLEETPFADTHEKALPFGVVRLVPFLVEWSRTLSEVSAAARGDAIPVQPLLSAGLLMDAGKLGPETVAYALERVRAKWINLGRPVNTTALFALEYAIEAALDAREPRSAAETEFAALERNFRAIDRQLESEPKWLGFAGLLRTKTIGFEGSEYRLRDAEIVAARGRNPVLVLKYDNPQKGELPILLKWTQVRKAKYDRIATRTASLLGLFSYRAQPLRDHADFLRSEWEVVQYRPHELVAFTASDSNAPARQKFVLNQPSFRRMIAAADAPRSNPLRDLGAHFFLQHLLGVRDAKMKHLLLVNDARLGENNNRFVGIDSELLFHYNEALDHVNFTDDGRRPPLTPARLNDVPRVLQPNGDQREFMRRIGAEADGARYLGRVIEGFKNAHETARSKREEILRLVRENVEPGRYEAIRAEVERRLDAPAEIALEEVGLATEAFLPAFRESGARVAAAADSSEAARNAYASFRENEIARIVREARTFRARLFAAAMRLALRTGSSPLSRAMLWFVPVGTTALLDLGPDLAASIGALDRAGYGRFADEIGLYRLRGTGRWLAIRGGRDYFPVRGDFAYELFDVFIHNHPSGHALPSLGDVAAHYNTETEGTPFALIAAGNEWLSFDARALQTGGYFKADQYTVYDLNEKLGKALRTKLGREGLVDLSDPVSLAASREAMGGLGIAIRSVLPSELSDNVVGAAPEPFALLGSTDPRTRYQALSILDRALPQGLAADIFQAFHTDTDVRVQMYALGILSMRIRNDFQALRRAVQPFRNSPFERVKEQAAYIGGSETESPSGARMAGDDWAERFPENLRPVFSRMSPAGRIRVDREIEAYRLLSGRAWLEMVDEIDAWKRGDGILDFHVNAEAIKKFGVYLYLGRRHTQVSPGDKRDRGVALEFATLTQVDLSPASPPRPAPGTVFSPPDATSKTAFGYVDLREHRPVRAWAVGMSTTAVREMLRENGLDIPVRKWREGKTEPNPEALYHTVSETLWPYVAMTGALLSGMEAQRRQSLETVVIQEAFPGRLSEYLEPEEEAQALAVVQAIVAESYSPTPGRVSGARIATTAQAPKTPEQSRRLEAIARTTGATPDNEIVATVRKLAFDAAKNLGLPSEQYAFVLSDSDEINAFFYTADGERVIQFNWGLVQFLHENGILNQAVIEFILGHEAGHSLDIDHSKRDPAARHLQLASEYSADEHGLTANDRSGRTPLGGLLLMRALRRHGKDGGISITYPQTHRREYKILNDIRHRYWENLTTSPEPIDAEPSSFERSRRYQMDSKMYGRLTFERLEEAVELAETPHDVLRLTHLYEKLLSVETVLRTLADGTVGRGAIKNNRWQSFDDFDLNNMEKRGEGAFVERYLRDNGVSPEDYFNDKQKDAIRQWAAKNGMDFRDALFMALSDLANRSLGEFRYATSKNEGRLQPYSSIQPTSDVGPDGQSTFKEPLEFWRMKQARHRELQPLRAKFEARAKVAFGGSALGEADRDRLVTDFLLGGLRYLDQEPADFTPYSVTKIDPDDGYESQDYVYPKPADAVADLAWDDPLAALQDVFRNYRSYENNYVKTRSSKDPAYKAYASDEYSAVQAMKVHHDKLIEDLLGKIGPETSTERLLELYATFHEYYRLMPYSVGGYSKDKQTEQYGFDILKRLSERLATVEEFVSVVPRLAKLVPNKYDSSELAKTWFSKAQTVDELLGALDTLLSEPRLRGGTLKALAAFEENAVRIASAADWSKTKPALALVEGLTATLERHGLDPKKTERREEWPLAAAKAAASLIRLTQSNRSNEVFHGELVVRYYTRFYDGKSPYGRPGAAIRVDYPQTRFLYSENELLRHLEGVFYDKVKALRFFFGNGLPPTAGLLYDLKAENREEMFGLFLANEEAYLRNGMPQEEFDRLLCIFAWEWFGPGRGSSVERLRAFTARLRRSPVNAEFLRAFDGAGYNVQESKEGDPKFEAAAEIAEKIGHDAVGSYYAYFGGYEEYKDPTKDKRREHGLERRSYAPLWATDGRDPRKTDEIRAGNDLYEAWAFAHMGASIEERIAWLVRFHPEPTPYRNGLLLKLVGDPFTAGPAVFAPVLPHLAPDRITDILNRRVLQARKAAGELSFKTYAEVKAVIDAHFPEDSEIGRELFFGWLQNARITPVELNGLRETGALSRLAGDKKKKVAHEIIERMGDDMERQSVEEKREVYLWLAGLAPKPTLIEYYEFTSKTDLDDLPRLLAAGTEAERYAFLTTLLVGDSGVLSDPVQRADLMKTLFEAGTGEKAEASNTRFAVLEEVFEACPEHKQFDILHGALGHFQESSGTAAVSSEALTKRFLTSFGLVGVKFGQQVLGIEDLSDRVPPLDKRYLLNAILHDGGMELLDDVASIDEELGSASVKQSYVMTLKNGDRRAIKYVRPLAEFEMVENLAIMRNAIQRLRFRIPALKERVSDSLLDEIEKSVQRELDIRQEVLSQRELGRFSRGERHGGWTLKVPRVDGRFVGSRYFADEYVVGEAPKAAFIAAAGEKTAAAFAGLTLKTVVKQALLFGKYHGDLNRGNLKFDVPGTTAHLIDFGNTATLSRANQDAFVLLMDALAASHAPDALAALRRLAPAGLSPALEAKIGAVAVLADVPAGAKIQRVKAVIEGEGGKLEPQIDYFLKVLETLSYLTGNVSKDQIAEIFAAAVVRRQLSVRNLFTPTTWKFISRRLFGSSAPVPAPGAPLAAEGTAEIPSVAAIPESPKAPASSERGDSPVGARMAEAKSAALTPEGEALKLLALYRIGEGSGDSKDANRFAFSPGGSRLLHRDRGRVSVIDPATGKTVSIELPGGYEWASFRGENVLYVSFQDKTERVYALRGNEIVQTIEDEDEPVLSAGGLLSVGGGRSLSFSDDGSLILVVSDTGYSVRLSSTGETLAIPDARKPKKVELSGNYVVVSFDGGRHAIYLVAENKLSVALTDDVLGVPSIERGYAYAVPADGRARVWELVTGRRALDLEGRINQVKILDGRWAVTVGANDDTAKPGSLEMQLYDLRTGENFGRKIAPEARDFAVDGNGRYVDVFLENERRLFDSETGADLSPVVRPGYDELSIRGNRALVKYGPAARMNAFDGRYETLYRLIDLETGKEITVEGLEAAQRATLAPDGSALIFRNAASDSILADVSGKTVDRFGTAGRKLYSAGFLPSGVVETKDQNNRSHLFDLKTGNSLDSLTGPQATQPVVSSDGKRVVVMDSSRYFRLVDIETMRRNPVLAPHAARWGRSAHFALEILAQLKREGRLDTAADLERLLPRVTEAIERYEAAVTDYNRDRVVGLFLDGNSVLSAPVLERVTASGGDSLEFFLFCIELMESDRRLAFQILDGVFTAAKSEGLAFEENSAVTAKLPNDERERIRRFVALTRNFNPELYRYFLATSEAKLKELLLFSEKILSDEAGMPEIEAFLARAAGEKDSKGRPFDGEQLLYAVVQRAIPPSGASFVRQTEALGLMKKYLEAARERDPRGDVPTSLKALGRFGGGEVRRMVWRRRADAGDTWSPEVAALIDALRYPDAARPTDELKAVVASDRARLSAALTDLLKDFDNDAKRDEALAAFLAHAAHSDALKEKVDRIQTGERAGLRALDELFFDKDNLAILLNEILADFNLEGEGAVRDGKRLARSLGSIWALPLGEGARRARLGIALAPVRNDEVRSKILSALPDVPGLRAEVEKLLDSRVKLPGGLIDRLFEKPRAAISLESERYVEIPSDKAVRVRFQVVKGPLYGMWGLNAGVCIAADVALWKRPEFFLLAMIDEETGSAVGFTHLFTKDFEVDGKTSRHLTVPGINPSTEILSEVRASELYPMVEGALRTVAAAEGYDQIDLPTDKNVLSNRSDIVDQAVRSGYDKDDLPEEVGWNSVPQPYPFKNVFVIPKGARMSGEALSPEARTAALASRLETAFRSLGESAPTGVRPDTFAFFRSARPTAFDAFARRVVESDDALLDLRSPAVVRMVFPVKGRDSVVVRVGREGLDFQQGSVYKMLPIETGGATRIPLSGVRARDPDGTVKPLFDFLADFGVPAETVAKARLQSLSFEHGYHLEIAADGSLSLPDRTTGDVQRAQLRFDRDGDLVSRHFEVPQTPSSEIRNGRIVSLAGHTHGITGDDFISEFTSIDVGVTSVNVVKLLDARKPGDPAALTLAEFLITERVVGEFEFRALVVEVEPDPSDPSVPATVRRFALKHDAATGWAIETTDDGEPLDFNTTVAELREDVETGARMADERKAELDYFFEENFITSGAVADGSIFDKTPMEVVHRSFAEIEKLRPLRDAHYLSIGAGDLRDAFTAAYVHGMRVTAIEKDPRVAAGSREILGFPDAAKFHEDRFEFKEGDALAESWSDKDVVSFFYTEPPSLAEAAAFRARLAEKAKELPPGAVFALLFTGKYFDVELGLDYVATIPFVAPRYGRSELRLYAAPAAGARIADDPFATELLALSAGEGWEAGAARADLAARDSGPTASLDPAGARLTTPQEALAFAAAALAVAGDPKKLPAGTTFHNAMGQSVSPRTVSPFEYISGFAGTARTPRSGEPSDVFVLGEFGYLTVDTAAHPGATVTSYNYRMCIGVAVQAVDANGRVHVGVYHRLPRPKLDEAVLDVFRFYSDKGFHDVKMTVLYANDWQDYGAVPQKDVAKALGKELAARNGGVPVSLRLETHSHWDVAVLAATAEGAAVVTPATGVRYAPWGTSAARLATAEEPAESLLAPANASYPRLDADETRVRTAAGALAALVSRIPFGRNAFAMDVDGVAATARREGETVVFSSASGARLAAVPIERESAKAAAAVKSIPDYLREFDGATTRVEEAMLLAFGAEGLETLTAEPRSIAIDIGVLPAKRPEYLENLFVQLLAMRARPVAANVSFRLTGPGVQEALASSDLARQLVRKGIIDQTPDPKLKTAEIAGINRIESLSGETYLPFRAVEITDKEAGVPKWQAMILLAVMASEIGKKTEDPVLLRQFYEAYRDVSGLSVEKLEPAKLLEALKAFLTGTASKSLAEDYAMRAAPIDINRIIQLFSNIKRIVASAA